MKITPGFVPPNALSGITSRFAASLRSIKHLSAALLEDAAPEGRGGARVSLVDGRCGSLQDGISLFRLSGKTLDEIRESLGGIREIFRHGQRSEMSALTDAERARIVRDIDGAIGIVASRRAVIEAQTVKMESVTSKLMARAANVVAAGSRILDADRARAVVAAAKRGILKKAGLSLAGQANQRQRNVIDLLQR